MKIHVDIDAGPLQRVLHRLDERLRDLTPAFREIGDGVVADAQMRFKNSRDPYGVAWQKLKAATLKRRRGGGVDAKPLLDTGRLRNSVTRRLLGPRGVEVGTNLDYAAIHQFGGTISFGARSQMVRLRKVMLDDGRTVTRFAKNSHKRATTKWGTNSTGWQVRIPARPFLAVKARGLPREYGEIIRDALERHLAKAAS
jgi:phage virion morphogenesis protein